MSAPTAPLNLRAHPHKTGVYLEWDTPASDGGSTITNYIVYRGLAPSPTTTIATTGVILYYDDVAVLSRDTIYFWSVAAVNADGTGTQATEAQDMIDLTGPWALLGNYNQTVYILQFKSSNSNGEETYYNEYPADARVEYKQTRIKTPMGQDLMATARIYVDGCVGVAADDKIRWGNSDYLLVLGVEEHADVTGTIIMKVILC
jgi:hypothetical protein